MKKPVLCGALLGLSMAVMATTPAPQHARKHASGLHAQLQSVDAKITVAQVHRARLQSQVRRLEQQNTAQQKQLQQRDAEIAALQQKLQAAGVPASGTSAGH
ncbi:MAG: hypothetical protein ACREPK_10200 [Rhodanobacteraceae bacterium]